MQPPSSHRLPARTRRRWPSPYLMMRRMRLPGSSHSRVPQWRRLVPWRNWRSRCHRVPAFWKFRRPRRAPPALGGILIEPAEEPVFEKRPGIEVPLQAASLSRRLLATGIDALILLVGFTLFGYIFFRVAGGVPPFKPAAGMTVVLLAILWLAYQSLLLIYTGSTPGLRLAKLRLNRFDDSAVPRRIRGWRVLAAVLSGISLGLGYAWCLLDEDQLCWHDRITKTYMAPRR